MRVEVRWVQLRDYCLCQRLLLLFHFTKNGSEWYSARPEKSASNILIFVELGYVALVCGLTFKVWCAKR